MPVQFAQHLVSSAAFGDFYADGMALVEETACYLDGPGRHDARQLNRAASLLFTTESMRLTTRLMQAASWLLLLRAIRDGEMNTDRATREKSKMRLDPTPLSRIESELDDLPDTLRDLIERSIRLHERIRYLDELLFRPQSKPAAINPVRADLDRLQAAFVSD